MNAIRQILTSALQEDLGEGDITTNSTVPDGKVLNGQFVAKQAGVIAGLDVVGAVFKILDDRVTVRPAVTDGETVSSEAVLATATGPGRAMLSGERVALNILQRMSGIATGTRSYVDAVRHTKAIILDTRKTSPGIRLLDKMAVQIGGGHNHRSGLFDMVLLKENHILVAGGISQAVVSVRSTDTQNRPIEVEVRNLDELREAMAASVDRILLDNMNIEQLRRAVEIAGGRVPLEASGSVTLENVGKIAETGVDFISVGRLTHSVSALDISFLIQ